MSQNALNDLFFDTGDPDSLDKTESQILQTTENSIWLGALARPLAKVASVRHEAIIVGNENGQVSLAMTEPNNGARLGKLAHLLHVPLTALTRYKITAAQYRELQAMAYGDNSQQQPTQRVTGALSWNQLHKEYGAPPEDTDLFGTIEEVAETDDGLDSRTPRDMRDFARRLLRDAYASHASDIHIESGVTTGCVRFRIDGMMADHILNIPPERMRNITNTFANMASIPYHQLHQKPFDGTIRLRVRLKSGAEQPAEYRVCFLPVKRGVDVTIRQNAEVITKLDQLGLESEQMEAIYRAVAAPQGLVLVTGPTGSGKSNTRESLLAILQADRSLKICEAGDPIEFDSPHRTQVQITPTCPWDVVMNGFLRSDPDVISPSEFRDAEQAKFVVNAALTGHLVITTFHTNDVASTFTRLTQLGVDPAFQADAITLVISQRLVRVLCPRCKQPDPSDQMPGGGFAFRAPSAVDRGSSYCHYCTNTGYRGRTAIAEVVSVSERLHGLILQLGQRQSDREGAVQITGADIVEAARQEAQASGRAFFTLEDAAMRKLAHGITSRREIERVLKLTPKAPDFWRRRTSDIPQTGHDWNDVLSPALYGQSTDDVPLGQA